MKIVTVITNASAFFQKLKTGDQFSRVSVVKNDQDEDNLLIAGPYRVTDYRGSVSGKLCRVYFRRDEAGLEESLPVASLFDEPRSYVIKHEGERRAQTLEDLIQESS